MIYDPVVGDPDSGIDPGTAFEAIPEDYPKTPKPHVMIIKGSFAFSRSNTRFLLLFDYQ
jgi:rubredoxin